MLRNWYAVYTKPQKEKIVLSAFAKKGFESFCPVINTVNGKSNNKRSISEPLFVSHVFVYLNESEISSVKLIPGVVSIFYWKSKPAIIKTEEIDAIRFFAANCSNIKLIKSGVNINQAIRTKDEPFFSYHENNVAVKYQTIKVCLPSLGYTIVAERNTSKEKPILEEQGLFRTFPKKINSFFFN